MTRKAFFGLVILILFAVLLGGQGSPAWAAPLPQDDAPPAPPDFAARLEGQISRLPGAQADEPLAMPSSPAGTWDRQVAQYYRENDDGSWDFEILYIAPGINHTITYNEKDDIHPRLNPGGTMIVFSSDHPTGINNLFVINVDGTGLTQLTNNGADNVYPAWSRDGSRIAYQSYVDGQAEIYIMDANGANPTRLTADPYYDGMPSFSPDGSQIAFVSGRGGHNTIWVMNADGSNPVELTGNLFYSSRPSWSPDGSRIAFSAETNADGWLEIWMMNADGSGQTLVRHPSSGSDYWVNCWTPDGKKIVVTWIHYIYYNGNWYWTKAYFVEQEPGSPSGSLIYLYENITSWNMDWRSADGTPPAVTITSLPATSPYQFLVSWSGQDGETGLRDYDVQYKDGSSGAWTDWFIHTTSTSATFTGVGGHTYYFRVRARDWVFNTSAWPANPQASTTVESRPPNTIVDPLPEFWRSTAFTVSWGGTDPGDSGIASYDIQYNNFTGGDWQDWLNSTTTTSATFNGEYGRTYAFRLRGRDNAQNVEPWSERGNPRVTLYAWSLRGWVYDNTGTPIIGAMPDISPQHFLAMSSDPTGSYALYTDTNPDIKSASWNKPGYGSLPETSLGTSSDAMMDAYLPPADDIVQDGGFESGSLAPAWQAGGVFTPVLTSTTMHSGDYASLLGEAQSFLPPSSLSEDWVSEAQVLMDAGGVLHIAMLSEGEAQKVIHYLQRLVDGTWLPAEIVAQAPSLGEVSMALGQDGTVHLAWDEMGINYRSRSPEGEWSTTEQIAAAAYSPTLAVDANNTLHTTWISYSYFYFFQYAQRPEGGSWSVPVTLFDGYINDHKTFVSDAGQVDILATNYYSMTHISRSVDGTWSDIQEVGEEMEAYYFDLFPPTSQDPDQIGLFISNYHLMTARLNPAGMWSTPVNLLPETDVYVFYAVMDAQGTLHLIYNLLGSGTAADVYYMKKESGADWTSPSLILHADIGSLNASISPGPNGEVMLVWGLSNDGGDNIYFASIQNGQVNNPTQVCAWCGTQPHLVISPNGEPLLYWLFGSLYYTAPTPAAETGPSQISQTLTLTPSLEAPVLSFLYQMSGASATAGTGLNVQVSDVLSTTTLLSTTANTGWTHAWFDLSPWLSQTVTLTFQARQVQGYPAVAVYLDEVSLGSAYPDAWVSLSGSPAAALPGQQVSLLLRYGNRGGVDASGVSLDLTLPDGVNFIDASLPPSSTAGPLLSWDLGDLPPRGATGLITLTVEVDADAPRAVELVLNADITASRELETDNNNDRMVILSGLRIYAPILQR